MFYSRKKVLVTGGAGFIGSRLVRQLARHNADVTVIDDLSRGKTENLADGASYCIDIGKKLIVADLTDYQSCQTFIRDFDFVFHLADVVGGIHYVFSNETFIFRQNILINSNTLAACIESHIPNYIYIGTACSFPKQLQSSYQVSYLKEDQTYPADPESSYGWSKLIGEYEAELAEKKHQLRVGIIRAHNVYGPGSLFTPQTSQVIPALIRKAILYPDETFNVWGTGNQYRDFLYIDDVIDALLKLGENGMGKGMIQVGSGEATSIKSIAEGVKSLSGKNIEIIYDSTRNEGDKGRVAIIEKARRELDWIPQTKFHKGLELTYRWIEDKMRDEISSS